MNSKNLLKGVGVAMVTPFSETGKVDIAGLRSITKYLTRSKADYLTVMGTTAETATLSPEEKQLVIDTILEENNDMKPVVLGCGGNDTAKLVEEIKAASSRTGISAILSVSPYYNKPSQEGLFKHYTKLADASRLPIVLYNVPGRTGSNISSETVLKLSEHDNIIGIKDASGSILQAVEVIKYKPSSFSFISGDDDLILSQMALGADGIISVVANAYPDEMAAIVNQGVFENPMEARRHYYNIIEVIKLIFQEGNPTGIKCLLKLLGICSAYVRLPLIQASEELETRLREAIEFI